MHEDPQVPNYGRRGIGPKLKEGLVLAIEPMINLGTKDVYTEKDGWTVKTADGKPSVHFEHDVCVKKGKADILSDYSYNRSCRKSQCKFIFCFFKAGTPINMTFSAKENFVTDGAGKTGELIVIGGGAAGIFCAVNAAAINPKLKVTLLEKTSKLLSKVKVSGGGRCNVTHALFDIGEMSKRYPRGSHFVKKTFHQFFTTDTIQWFEERGVKLKAEKDGRMFPVTDSSQTIIDCLIKEANKLGVEILMNADVKELKKEISGFSLMLSRVKTCRRLCLCCNWRIS